MMRLYAMMLEKDATMVEINPMVEAQDPSGEKRGVLYVQSLQFSIATTQCIGGQYGIFTRHKAHFNNNVEL